MSQGHGCVMVLLAQMNEAGRSGPGGGMHAVQAAVIMSGSLAASQQLRIAGHGLPRAAVDTFVGTRVLLLAQRTAPRA